MCKNVTKMYILPGSVYAKSNLRERSLLPLRLFCLFRPLTGRVRGRLPCSVKQITPGAYKNMQLVQNAFVFCAKTHAGEWEVEKCQHCQGLRPSFKTPLKLQR